MPYEIDKREKLDELFHDAFAVVIKEREVNAELKEANISKSIVTIKREIKGKYEEILKKVESKISSYNSIERRLQEKEEDAKRLIIDFKETQLRRKVFSPAGIVEITKELFGFSVLSIKEGMEAEEFDLSSEPEEVQTHWRRIRLKLGIEIDEKDKEFLKSEIDSAIFAELKQTIRLTINSSVIKPNYRRRLKIFGALGLAEVRNSNHIIDTASKISLLYKLNTMHGGSIGIAGSRGAGKSTLIQMCCGDEREYDPIEDGKSLPVFTTAPVQYESRDFILYLFSSLCQRIIDPEMIGDTKLTAPQFRDYSQPSLSKPIINKFFNTAPRILYFFGVIMIIFSVLLLGVLFSSKTQATNQNSNQANTQTTNQNTSEADTQTGNQNLAQVNTQTNSQSSTARPVSAIETIIGIFEIKPGILLSWGFFLCFMGIGISAFARRFTNEIDVFPHDYEEYASASEQQQRKWKENAEKKTFIDKSVAPSPRKISFINLLLNEKAIEQREAAAFLKRLDVFETRKKTEKDSNGLATKAREWLNEIKFQQSFTAGWSGGLKLPVGLEAGVNRSIQLAQRQMTNPEIVAAFIKFIKDVTKEYTVIIGIDEMDKMESEGEAEKFLNEIKSIFGLPKCFYLISVSENAMSSFERRGMPFRDVFDSSFDDVVYVEHLNRKTAKELLLRRIDGNPQPFIYLSYCMAGGLPRDMIRTFRNLLEFNQEDATRKGRDLKALCHAIITKEIKAKVRAVSASVRKIKIEPESGEFFEMLARLDSPKKLDQNYLLNMVEALFQWQSSRKLEANSSDEEKENIKSSREIEKLTRELGCYVYFLTTIFEFFDNSLNEKKLTEALAKGHLENLAKARQLMEINADATINILDGFRSDRTRKMNVPQLKKPPTVVEMRQT